MPDKQEKLEPVSEELLVAYLDGELDVQTAGQVQRRLENDPDPRRFVSLELTQSYVIAHRAFCRPSERRCTPPSESSTR